MNEPPLADEPLALAAPGGDAATACGREKSVVRQLFGGAAWTMCGMAAARGAVLVSSLLTARILGRLAFGELGVIENTVGMLAVLANMGLSLTTTKYVASYRVSDPRRAGRVLGLCATFAAASSAAIGIGVCGLAPMIAEALAAPHLAAELRLATLILLFSSVNGALGGGLIGLQAHRDLARISLVGGAVTISCVVGGAAAGGLTGAIIGLLVAQAGYLLLTAAGLHRAGRVHGIRISLAGSWRERRMLTAFSLPALINSALRSPVNWLCLTILVNQDGGYAEMGLLHAVHPWFLLLLFLPGQLSNVYFPMFEEALARGDAAGAGRLLRKSIQLNAVVCSVLAFGMIAAADLLLACYGPSYSGGDWVLRITMLAGLASAVQQPMTAYLIAASSMWLVTTTSIAWAAATMAAAILLSSDGALGIAAARLAGFAVSGTLVLLLVRGRVGRSAPHPSFARREPELSVPAEAAAA